MWRGINHNFFYGGAGNDELRGADGVDHLYGGAGVDELDGGAGNDVLDGGVNDNLLLGFIGDRLTGGPGADQFRRDDVTELLPVGQSILARFVPVTFNADEPTDFNAAEGDTYYTGGFELPSLTDLIQLGQLPLGLLDL